MKMKDLALAQVRRGERFTLDGVEFVKLEDDLDAAFAVAADTLPECCQFEDDDAEREDHNNYAGSLLSKTVERWLRDKHPAIFSAVVERPIDLTTMDGMTDYGKPLAVVRALTIDEYRKHRSILPLTSKPYWLATAWTTNSSPCSSADYAYCINTGGTVSSVGVYRAYFAPRPALYLKSSILVSVETEDEGKALADYSDTDLIDELRPAWVIGENVANILNLALDDVLSDLESKGYAARAFMVPARGVGAPHQRYRFAIVAHADGDGRVRAGPAPAEGRIPHQVNAPMPEGGLPGGGGYWKSEPGMDRMVDGLPNWMDRVRCLGNAVCPPQFFPFFQQIRLIEEAEHEPTARAADGAGPDPAAGVRQTERKGTQG